MSTVPSDLEMPGNGTTGAQPAWKRELNDKIAAARAKRQGGASAGASKPARGEVMAPGEADSRAARVAAAVAARYAQAPTYSEYLASEVRAAMTAAVLAQESAARAVAEAEQARAIVAQLTAPMAEAPAPVEVQEESRAERLAAPAKSPAKPMEARVDYAASGIPARAVQDYTANTFTPEPRANAGQPRVVADPMAEAIITPSTPLPANLLEFPRELIAARKARPRHAEGPLRDEPGDASQLRIFEVEPEAISTAIEPAPQATEWSSIRLDAYPAAYAAAHPTDVTASAAADTVSSNHSHSNYGSSGVPSRYASQRPNHDSRYAHDREAVLVNVASLEDRLMAAIVDVALVGIAFLLFALVFSASTLHPPTGRPAVIGSALVIAGFYLLYQFLFFTFADGTPGMLYARIALCTFEDDNPSREAMRKRIFAVVLAGMPLGLGFLYAIFDEEHLGWHDRMTRMYQRSYR